MFIGGKTSVYCHYRQINSRNYGTKNARSRMLLHVDSLVVSLNAGDILLFGNKIIDTLSFSFNDITYYSWSSLL